MSPERKFANLFIGMIGLLLALFALSGCKTNQEIRYVPIVQRHDSIVIRTQKDTVIVYPKQANRVLGVKRSRLETDLATSDAAIDENGQLNHSIENKGTIPSKLNYEKISIRDTVQVPFEVEVQVPGKPIVVEVPVKGFYYQFGVWVFYILLVLIALAIYFAVKYPATTKKFRALIQNLKNK